MPADCRRCGKPTNGEWLRFASQYRETKIELCDLCFALARKTFEHFVNSADAEAERLKAPDPRSEPQTPRQGDIPTDAGPQSIEESEPRA